MARKFGLEVEYIGPVDEAVDALREAGLAESRGVSSYMANSASHWIVKLDGSVGGGGEMVSPPLDFDDPEQRAQVNKAIKALRSVGASVGQPCGIHVHIDCNDLTAEQVACVARTFTKFEDVIYRLATSGWRTLRPGGVTYCRPLDQRQVDGIAKAKNERQLSLAYFGREHTRGSVAHHDGARYRGINLQSWFYRGTIEFRVFNSSLNADRIQAYIAICMALVQDARNGKKRSVNKAFRLGGMLAGTTNAAAAYHRFQQVVRYEAGMEMADYKLMNKCWKDSTPQARIGQF